MPIITVNLTEGRAIDAKRRFASGITCLACDCFGVNPSDVRVIFDETSPDNFAVAGTLLMDMEK